MCLLAACTGVVNDPGAQPIVGTGGPQSGPVPHIPGLGCARVEVPTAPTRHLSRAQYNNTVRDLLGTDLRPALNFAPDDSSAGLEIGLNVSPLLVEQYHDAARMLAADAALNVDALVSCEGLEESVCADRFIEDFGLRAFRRPLSADDRTQYRELYDAGASPYDFATGIEMVVHAMLASPEFLYLLEDAPDGSSPGDIVPVTGYAMASRLSYFLWNTMPDDALFAAAAAGELDTAEGIRGHAERMLEDPRARTGLENFYRQWLHLDGLASIEKDTSVYPGFSSDVASDLRASVGRFVEHVVFDQSANVGDLFTDETMFLNERLGALYGQESLAGNELQAVAADSTERAGLLTQPGLMALLGKGNQSDPIHRGVFVRTEMLCQPLPPPPPDLVVSAPDPEPGISTRERFAEHTENEACQGCHSLIDPIGFGLENYDGIGRYRAEDEGAPVDASGELLGTEDIDGAFSGAVELSGRLAASGSARECVATKLFRYSVTRTELDVEACQLEHLVELAADSDWNVKTLLAELTQLNSFLYSRVPEVN